MTDLSIIPFGGVRENGKNLYVVTIEDDIFILDAGLKYPETDQLGIDVVIPEMSYLVENKQRIAGVFLTHGHADAIGAMPFLLEEVDVPIFGSDMTIALAKLAVEQHGGIDNPDYHVVTEKSEITFDNDVKVSFFSTTHSIPESLGIVLQTKQGKIVYTGDFKFDQTAQAGYQTDLARLVEIGQDQDVLALLADSAGTESNLSSINESKIERYVLETFRDNKKKRIIVAAVASNIQRIQQVINAAVKTHRKIVMTGKDIENIVRTAIRHGKITFDLPYKELFVSIRNLGELAPHETVILATGRMGEPIKHLRRIAQGEDRLIKITKDDMVFITTTPSTAMEGVVAKVRDALFFKGADVRQISTDMHSSGHASRNDLQMLVNILKPQYFIPIQGEYRVMKTAKDTVAEVGIDESHTLMTMKGDQYKYIDGQFVLEDSFTVGERLIDGIGSDDIGNVVLHDRRILSEDGVFIAVVTIDRKKGQIISRPKLSSRGFIYVKDNRDLMAEVSDLIVAQIETYLANTKQFDWNELKNGVRDKIAKFLFNQTRRKPVIMPVVMEVNQNRRPSNTNKAHANPQQAQHKSGQNQTKKVASAKNNAKAKPQAFHRKNPNQKSN